MPLQRGEILGHDFNRMVVDFTMLNQDKTVRCAISTAAMDDLEGTRDVSPACFAAGDHTLRATPAERSRLVHDGWNPSQQHRALIGL
jgi:hypothetical protein